MWIVKTTQFLPSFRVPLCEKIKMQKPVVRQLLTILLVLIYINRGFFIFGADEMKSPDGEINCVAELLVELITGESNDIDEDGDMQTDCNSTEITHYDFSQQLAQNLELTSLFSKNIKKTGFSNNENFPKNNFNNQIDHPPENNG
jgi:hypothetical protein